MPDVRSHIAVGVIFNRARDKVLLARRPDHLPQGGLWEFPGGKRGEGENIEAALRRELSEELNMSVERATPILKIDHDYPDRAVQLEVWLVEQWRGEVVGREGQTIEWVPIAKLGERECLAANRAIVAWLNLPPLYLITPDLPAYGRSFIAQLQRLLEAGVKLVQFRNSYLNAAERNCVVPKILALCTEYGARLLVNAAPPEALRYGAHGVHLNSTRLLELNERPLAGGYLTGASCHNRMELEHAARLKVDFAVVAPVRKTPSHAGAEPLGWQGFREIAASANIPIYALGGMQPEDMAAARRYGARGLAMISGIWSAADPVAAVEACLDGGTGY